MDLDRGLLAASLREKEGYSVLKEVSEEMIMGDAAVAYRFISEFFMQYGKMPGYNMLVESTGIDLLTGVNAQEPGSFFVEKIRERHFWGKSRDGLQEAVRLLETQSSVASIKTALAKLLFNDLSDYSSNDTLPQSIFSNPQSLLDEYQRAKVHGVTGVETPWPTMNRMTMGWQPEDFILFVSRPGRGKCLGKGTPILMHDGSIKKVEDVQVGDQVMGPDSMPRNVLSTTTGREKMYRVNPVKGESWTCNESHILSLKISSTMSKKYQAGQIVNMSVREYLDQSPKFKHQAKLWRTGVDFSEKKIPIDPYLIGLWLGDGLRNQPVISNPDLEVKEFLTQYCIDHGYNLNDENRNNNNNCPSWRISNNYKGNDLTKFLREYCYKDKQKTIPRDYLVNSRENRLNLLAGLIDTDGYLHNGCFEIITKYDSLKDNILFLARSLGFAAYAKVKIGRIKSINFVAEYWRINILGEISEIPTKIERKKAPKRKQIKDVLVTGFKLEDIGEDDYYGFSVDKDHLFLLGDFTVTHNSWLLIMILLYAWERGNRVLLFSTEMSIIALKRRASALIARLSYGLIKAGRLHESEYDSYRETLIQYMNDDRFMIVGNDTTLKRSTIEQNIIMQKPDLVGIDGYYMVEDDIEKYSKDDLKMGGIWKTGKKLAKRHQVPIIVTHQLNRPPQGQKPGQKPDLARLAYSDAAGQYADYVFSIWQTDEMFNDKKLGLLPMKARDAEVKSDGIEMRWDLTNCLYHEIDKDSHVTVESSQLTDYRLPQEPQDVPF
jgi:replicative DNA helicase